MVLLRQINTPGSAAQWTEHMYSREYKVVNGEVEVENQDHITLLLGRGFKIVDEATKDTPVRLLGVIRIGDEVEPQGTQTVDADDAETTADEAEAEKKETEAETSPPPDPKPEPAPKKKRGRPRKNSQGAK